MALVAVPAAAGGDRPFKAKADRVSAEFGLFPECEGIVGERAVYTGTATHLGRVDLVEFLCLDFSEDPEDPLVPFVVYGEYVAANGDELTFFVEGVFNRDTGVVVDGGFDFTGGTGRFEDATGSGETDLIRDDGGTIVALRQVGRISY